MDSFLVILCRPEIFALFLFVVNLLRVPYRCFSFDTSEVCLANFCQ